MTYRERVRNLLKEVEDDTGVTISDMLGTKRFPRYVQARRKAMLLCKKDMGMTYNDIADIFDKDVSTVAKILRGI